MGTFTSLTYEETQIHSWALLLLFSGFLQESLASTYFLLTCTVDSEQEIWQQGFCLHLTV